mmetsp:Transcript_13153/g.21885  ORF Transcript_13153/g.21885 Transcript_13153/m.21885 type:complete len:555 (+) Transcript_13153:460-2124(+)
MHCVIFALLLSLEVVFSCPIREDTRIVYSLANGVGPASKIWVEDFLWWWQSYDPTIQYMALSAEDLKDCILKNYPNLNLYINPGGNAYDQLSDLGPKGTQHIIDFVYRNQQHATSAYVGFCAGGYVAAHDFIWETMYEGVGFYNFTIDPPLSIFPHTVEGSIVDINDDQYGDQKNSKFRSVNVSNGHTMLYYGGSTFGWNGAPAYADETSPDYDARVEVLVYYTDFYGYYSQNIPAAWKYGRNVLLTSVHPEADNCTFEQDTDCPPAGTLSTEVILQNRAWLSTYINEVAQTQFKIPPVPLAPVFNTTPPHRQYAKEPCYENYIPLFSADNSLDGNMNGNIEGSSGNSIDAEVLFCEDFDSLGEGDVPSGLSPQFQRNQSNYQYILPWNTTYISSWGGYSYAEPYSGDGYAINVPQAPSKLLQASITTREFSATACTYPTVNKITSNNTGTSGEEKHTKAQKISIEYVYAGVADVEGYMEVQYSDSPSSSRWERKYETVAYHKLQGDKPSQWRKHGVIADIAGSNTARVRFICAAGASARNFCALDSLFIVCAY